MSRAKKFIDTLQERGPQYRTKVKNVESNLGSGRIRNLVEKSLMYVEQMLNPKHDSPNPVDEDSKKNLEACRDKLGEVIQMMKEIKETKRRPR